MDTGEYFLNQEQKESKKEKLDKVRKQENN